MKTLILGLLVSFNSFAGVAIISDLDDTIKITHVARPSSAVARGIFRKQIFTGMSEFLAETRSYSSELHVLTASPSIIKYSVRRTLNRNHIKHDSIAFKNPFKREGKIEFKVGKIREIMDKSDHDFIFMGDDVDKDPEVFQEVQKLYPTRVLATYVHSVRGRPIPAGSTVYYTSADLALHEMLAGRMDEASAEKVLDTILTEDELHHVIPYFASCPKENTVWKWQLATSLSEKALQNIERLNKYCMKLFAEEFESLHKDIK